MPFWRRRRGPAISPAPVDAPVVAAVEDESSADDAPLVIAADDLIAIDEDKIK